MIYTEINITGLEEIKARVRELADLTERMHVALGKLENCKINIWYPVDFEIFSGHGGYGQAGREFVTHCAIRTMARRPRTRII